MIEQIASIRMSAPELRRSFSEGAGPVEGDLSVHGIRSRGRRKYPCSVLAIEQFSCPELSFFMVKNSYSCMTLNDLVYLVPLKEKQPTKTTAKQTKSAH